MATAAATHPLGGAPRPLTVKGRCGASGSSLIETLVALALVAVALLLGVSFYVESVRALMRFEARAAALDDLDRTVEQMRAGVLPLRVGTSTFDGRASSLTLTISTTEVPALFRVQARAAYTVHGHQFARDLETAVWRP